MVFARCPYCDSWDWDYMIYPEPVRESWGNGEGFYEYSHAVCCECEKEFIVKDSYEIVESESSECMTIEEFKKKSE